MDQTTSPYLDTWKDATVEVYIETPDGSSGRYVPAVGLSGMQLRIAATEQGAPIAALSGAVTERGVGAPGYYYRVIDLADLTTHLPEGTYPHRSTVYLQLYGAGNVEVEAFAKIVRRRKFG